MTPFRPPQVKATAGTPCFWIQPTGDALVTFRDGRTEVLPDERDWTKKPFVEGWTSWSPRYIRPETGEIRDDIHSFGPGAMFEASWFHSAAGLLAGPGPDGRVLGVILPNGTEWIIDSRASNCTEPCKKCGVTYDKHGDGTGKWTCPKGGQYEPADAGAHRCWVRHGEPPRLTVDKNGLTCQAGAGSIRSGGYHGHLVDGFLTGNIP